jgi:plasmid stabilization system protein ParE
MSCREFRIVLSELAETDIDDILAYTLGTWGEIKLIEYRAVLDAALRTSERNPNVARDKSKLKADLRSSGASARNLQLTGRNNRAGLGPLHLPGPR